MSHGARGGASAQVEAFEPSISARIPELDGLRGTAILLVLICHYFANASHPPIGFVIDHLITITAIGWSGVDLFFVLSGFLIGGILLDCRESPNYFKAFYLRRVHRILPVYYGWIVLFALAVLTTAYVYPKPLYLNPPGMNVSIHELRVIPTYLAFLQNIFYSPTPPEWIWFVVTWSLAVEEQFYIVAPPLIRYLSKQVLIGVLVLTVCAAPFLRFFMFRFHPEMDHFYQFGMPCRADSLSLGMLAALAWRWPQFRRFLAGRPQLAVRFVAYSFVGVIALLWWLVRPPNVVTATIGYSWLAFFCVFVLVLVLSRPQSLLGTVMRTKWLRGLGTISYCVYVIHFAVNQLAHRLLLNQEPSIGNVKGILVTLCATGVTLTIASLSWKYLEKPMVSRGHRFSYN